MNKLGGASQATDRRIKGVTGQSANASKNFSKQAQTMQGGIVAVYATIAAQIFAISAAFQFLKDAMDTRNMIEGQLAFGAATGVAYKSLTENISKAAGGMIQFQQAAESAAIGTAAGLSAGQLERLGRAAKNTSLALGRDLTDSFNRLVRGATKAEPELLDELGIVLRLEPAMKKYAAQIGKSAATLNQFEKTQAVTNEVLDQAESKFGIMELTMDESAFALNQFLKAWDDFMKGVKKVVGDVAAKVLPFFSKNILALVGALTLFLIPILRSILPDFAAMGLAAESNFGQAQLAADEAALAFERASRASQMAGGGMVGVGEAAKAEQGFAKEHGINLGGESGGEKTLTKRQLAARKREFAKDTSKWKKDPKINKAYAAWLGEQEVILNASQGKKQNMLYRLHAWRKKQWAKQLKNYAIFNKGMVWITKWAAKAMNAAMKMMGFLGLALMIWEASKALFNFIKGVDELKEKQKEMAKEAIDKYALLKVELDEMNRIQGLGVLDLPQQLEQLGNAVQSFDIKTFADKWNELLSVKDAEDRNEALDEMVESYDSFIKVLPKSKQALGANFRAQMTASQSSETLTNITYDANEQFGVYTGKLVAASMASKMMAEDSNSLIKSLRGVVSAAKDMKFTQGIQDLRKTTGSYTALGSVEEGAFEKNEAGRMAAANALSEFEGEGSQKWGQTKLDRIQAAQAVAGKRKYTTSEMNEARKAKNAFGQGRTLSRLSPEDRADYDKANEKYQAMDAQNKAIKATDNSTVRGYIAEWTKLTQAVKDNVTQKEGFIKQQADDKARNIEELALLTEMLRIREAFATSAKNTADWQAKAILLGPEQSLIKQNELAENLLEQTKEKKIVKDEELASALLAEKLAKKEGKNTALEDIENIENTVALARVAVTAATNQVTVETTITKMKKLQNKWSKLNATLAHTQAIASKKRAVDESKRARREKLAVGAAAKQLVMLEKTKGMKAEIDDLETKALAIDQEILDMDPLKLTYADDLLKKQRDANILRQEAINKEQKILDLLLAQSSAQALANFESTGKDKAEDFARLFGMYDEGSATGTDKGPFGRVAGMGAFKGMAAKYSGNQAALARGLKLNKVTSLEAYRKKSEDELTVGNAKFVMTEDQAARKAALDADGQRTFAADEAERMTEALKKGAIAQADLENKTKLFTEVQSTISSAFDSMFDALFDNTKSFGDAMKDLLSSLAQDLAKLYLKQAAMSMIGAMGFPGLGGRYGGELTSAGRSFAAGGIASGPGSGYVATLHGREAVVPLGNDRSIPVDIRGASGNIVNVAVNISGGQSQTSVSGGGDMQALGRSIGGMVQQHLQVEMRPGGLLNRQGAKGRGG
jgi:hypothetical protein